MRRGSRAQNMPKQQTPSRTPSHGTCRHRPRSSGPRLVCGRCRRGPLPDRRCTPGAVFHSATSAQACRPGYSGRVRNVSTTTKNTAYRAYGMPFLTSGGAPPPCR